MRILPFLMFQKADAEAAMKFYVSLFPDARIDDVVRYGPDRPGGPDGTVMKASFTIAGQTVLCIDSPVRHAFGFTPSFTFFVDCDSEADLRRIAGALSEAGSVMMPVDSYGFSRLFTWVSDRFGVSWQLNLP